MTLVTREHLQAAREIVSSHVYHTPLLTSRLLSEETGCQVRLKAESFQRTGSYKIRGALNKLGSLTPEERERGVVCSSAGNHAQGVAMAGALFGIRTVVCMAENATASKIEATRAYGAEVVLHGSIWDEANERALQFVEEEGLTYVHPFDDPVLIAGQGTLGMEIAEDLPEVDLVLVPIGGGGLISGVASALKAVEPSARVIGVESSERVAMKASVEQGRTVRLEQIDTTIDGLRVKQVGEHNLAVVRELVDDIVPVPDEQIFESMLWTMAHTKVVVERAAAAPVAALRHGTVQPPAGSHVVCVLSGGNVDRTQMKGASVELNHADATENHAPAAAHHVGTSPTHSPS